MKAIVTKKLGGGTKGPRILAKAEGSRVIIPYSYSGKEHQEAALALCEKLDWHGTLVEGGMPDGTGHCYVWVTIKPDRKVIPSEVIIVP